MKRWPNNLQAKEQKKTKEPLPADLRLHAVGTLLNIFFICIAANFHLGAGAALASQAQCGWALGLFFVNV